jgi:hypothetical protein
LVYAGCGRLFGGDDVLAEKKNGIRVGPGRIGADPVVGAQVFAPADQEDLLVDGNPQGVFHVRFQILHAEKRERHFYLLDPPTPRPVV